MVHCYTQHARELCVSIHVFYVLHKRRFDWPFQENGQKRTNNQQLFLTLGGGADFQHSILQQLIAILYLCISLPTCVVGFLPTCVVGFLPTCVVGFLPTDVRGGTLSHCVG